MRILRICLSVWGNRKGQALVSLGLVLPVILAMGALAVDVGYLLAVRTELQRTADASALAAVQALPDEGEAVRVAVEYSETNDPEHGAVVGEDDVIPGHWDSKTGVFTPGGTPANAVQVFAFRNRVRGNAPRLFFARIFGLGEADVVAAATAVGGSSVGAHTRWIVDAEMIDSDIPVIEDLARRLGMDSEELISDNDGDWFIDIPPGEVLELPTGQVGDEGLFDITHSAFPFQEGSSPSFMDFLNYNEDSSSWRYGLIPKSMLDPLLGVWVVNDRDKYPEFVDPEHCQVSPVYKSDVNELNPVASIPAVNALGERRGLLAFKVLAVGNDPDGVRGSVLPYLVIEVCPPQLGPGPGGLAVISLGAGDQTIKLVN